MKHLLTTKELTREDAELILDVTEQMAEAVTGREVPKLPALRGRTVVNLFFEDSTRTRISFETAAKRLSADVINFSAKGSSVSKGESLKDTAQTLQAMGADAVVIRHHASGAPHRLAHAGWVETSVVNAGDGTHQHPTQALLDAFTIRRHLAAADPRDTVGRDLTGLRVAIVGDAAHTVPPTGAKGMNLAVADVLLLNRALQALLLEDDERLIDGFADAALKRIWKAQHFSWWMTSMLHVTGDPFDAQLQRSQLEWVVRSPSAAAGRCCRSAPISRHWPPRRGRSPHTLRPAAATS